MRGARVLEAQVFAERIVVDLVRSVAPRLEEVARQQRLPYLKEQTHLQPAIDNAVREFAAAGRCSWSKDQPPIAYFPKMGPLDLVVVLPAFRAGVELKAGSDLDACAWDALKLAVLQRERALDIGYLIAAFDPAVSPRGAELLGDGVWEATWLRERFKSGFKRWERDGYPMATKVPSTIKTAHVVTVPLVVAGKRWDLRAA